MSMRSRLVVLALLVTPLVLAGQDPSDQSDQPIFRAEVTYIEVDVYATDRSGTFVRDLTIADFELLQDGEPQEVADLSLVDLPLPSSQRRAQAGPVDTRAFTTDAYDGDGRVYALLLDAPVLTAATVGTRSDEVRRTQLVARQFLDEALDVDDVMKVVHVQRGSMPVAELTSSRPHLRAAIDGLEPSFAEPGLQMRQVRLRTMLNALRAIERTAEQLGRIDGRRKAILWVGGQVPFDAADERQGWDAAEAAAITFAQRDAVRAAARNNVAIYPIDPFGLSTRSGANELARVSGLRTLAHETGGIALVNTNNFAGGFERIVLDNSTYYLLGYYPALEHRDGRFHEITVRVTRPGVTVRARPGFYAPEGRPATLVLEPEERTPRAAALDALGNTNFREPLRLRASSWAAGGAVWIVGELDAQARRERGWADGATAEISLMGADGTRAFEQALELAPADPSFAVRVPDRLGPGSYTVRVQLRGGDAASASEMARVTIADDATPLGDAVLWRRGPSTGRQHVQTADPRFRRNEQLRLELPTRSEAEATAQMLDRNGEPMQIPLQVSARPEDDLTWIVIDVPLAPLAPSDYAIEVTQDGAARVTAFRMVP